MSSQGRTPGVHGQEAARLLSAKLAYHRIGQAKIAEMVGVSQGQVSKLLTGKAVLDLDLAFAMLHAIGEDPMDFIREIEASVHRPTLLKVADRTPFTGE